MCYTLSDFCVVSPRVCVGKLVGCVLNDRLESLDVSTWIVLLVAGVTMVVTRIYLVLFIVCCMGVGLVVIVGMNSFVHVFNEFY